MLIVPFIVTYNGMATGPAVNRCVEYLMAEAPPSFGAAIERVDIYAHCQTREPVIASLTFMDERFQARLAVLPFLRFRRKTWVFEVAYASRLVHDDAMLRSAETALSPADFDLLCREFAGALSLIRHRVKRSDGFELDGLDVHLQRRLESLQSEVTAHRAS